MKFLFFLLFPVLCFSQDLPVRFVTADQEWAPFVVLDPSGPPTGLTFDVASLIVKKGLNRTMATQLFPWARAQELVKVGAADMTITLPTASRLEWAWASDQPLYSIYFKVYTRSNHPRLEEIRSIKTLEDIKRLGFITVSNLGNNWHRTNVEAKGIPTHYVRDDVTILRFLEAGRADLVIDSPFSLNPRIDQLNFRDKIVETDVKFDEVWFHLLVSKKSPLAKDWPQVNEAVTRIVGSDEYKKMIHSALEPQASASGLSGKNP